MEMQYSDGCRIFSDVRHFDLDIDNQTLVDECRSGDRDALSILYTRFAPRMLHVISRYVGDRDTAHDILHDGFVAAFTRLDTLRDPERLDFWLATIMKNLSLKYLQAQTVASILNEIPDTPDEPELDDILDFATIESLIRQLPEGYQKVFRLAVLEGKSHKEISKILGIAPNSSSSQLFHAKIRLRQLIRDYQLQAGLITLLILLISVSALFLTHNADGLNPSDNLTTDATSQKPDSKSIMSTDQSIQSASMTSVTATTPVTAANPRNLLAPGSTASVQRSSVITALETARKIDPNEEHTLTPVVEDSVVQVYSERRQDVKKETTYQPIPCENEDIFLAENASKPQRNKHWTMGISVDPGLASFDGFGFNSDLTDASSSLIRPPIDDEPNEDEDNANTSASARAARHASHNSTEDYLSSFSRRHYLPISFALTAEKDFSSRFGIEFGIGYSYLHTDFENLGYTATCHWHYLELPVKINLYAYSTLRFKLYCSFGGRVAVPVYSYASIARNPYCQSGSFGSKPVWSVGGSVGLAFRLSKRIDLFMEPSLRYHFPQNAAIPNIWTDDEPWSISIPIGFRLSW